MNTNILAAIIVTVLSLTGFSPVAHAGIIINQATPTGVNFDYPPGPYAVPSSSSVQGDGIIVQG